MSRRPRLDGEGAVHHVMNRGVNRQQIFFGDVDRVEFGRLLAAIHARFGVCTLAYALMGNHYHLLLRTPDGGLSDAMHHLALNYVRRTNARIGRDGPLFRGRFHSIRVTTDAYLAHAARYIHRNPLAIVGVDHPSDHRWSSYRTYLGLRPPASFLDIAPVLSLFSHDRRALRAFTELNPSSTGPRLGSTADDIVQVVRLAIGSGVVLSGRGTDDRAPAWLEHTVLQLVVDALGPSRTPADVLADGSTASPAARRMARKRARDRAATDPRIRRLVGDVLELLGNDRVAA